VPSHFNVATAIDALIFNVMGLAIATLSVAHAVLWVLLLRTDWPDRPLLSACRWGAGVSLAGLMVGALMVVPTAPQLAQARAGSGLPVAGAHTVGRPDGGPGLPFLGWSVEAGDRRVPHFIGLHAMQAVPLALLVATWARPRSRKAVATVAGVACALLTAAVLAQAEAARPFWPGGGAERVDRAGPAAAGQGVP
jgi:cytochrome bd-type quinol oxidase subunit 2